MAKGTISKEHQLLRNRILKGLRLSFKRLVKETALRDGDLVFSINGKIKSIKARKIKI
jgi:hypothetical protein